MRRVFTALIILLSVTALSSAEETEHLITQKEFVKLEEASRKAMQIIIADYGNSLTPNKRVQFTKKQNLWLKNKTTQCKKMESFESRYGCLASAYGQRIRDIEEMLVMELKNKRVNFSRPKFPVSLSYGSDEFKMDIIEDGKYSFSFTVYGGNGHVCSGDGIAIWNGKSFTRLPDSAEGINKQYPAASNSSMVDIKELNKECRLEITFSPHFVTFSGNAYCHEYFMCGMRTPVYGEFKRNDFRMPKKAKPNRSKLT